MKLIPILCILTGCASMAQTPTPAPKVLISTDCRNPVTDADMIQWKENVTINLAKGETRCLWVKNETSTCVPYAVATPSIPSLSVAAFKPIPITTTIPSATSMKTGTFLDVLIPTSGSCLAAGSTTMLDLSTSSTSVAGSTQIKVGASSISVNVLNVTMPEHPTIPLMMAVGNWAAIRGLNNGQWAPKEAQVAATYPKIAQEHRITPYATEVVNPPIKAGLLDLDAPASGMSARDTWLKYAHNDFIPVPNSAWGQDVSDAFITYLRETEATIKAQGWQGKAWMYVEDEPEGFGTLERAKKKLQAIRQYAPSLKTMVTMAPVVGFEGLVDYYVRINSDTPRAGDWMYLSCVSHGCSQNRAWNGFKTPTLSDSGIDAGLPDYGAIERPGAYVRAFAWSLVKYGAKAGLYYNTLEHTNLVPKIDYFSDIFNWGGNGDGALFFPIPSGKLGFTNDSIGVSHRLKLIRESMFDLEYLLQMNADERKEFDAIFVSNKDFSKDYGRYQALRDRIAIRLAGAATPTVTPVPTVVPVPSPTVVPTPAQTYACTRTESASGFVMDCKK